MRSTAIPAQLVLRRTRWTALLVVGVVITSLALVSSVSADPAPGPGAVSQASAGSLPAGTVPDGTCAARVTAVGGGGASSPVSAGFGGTGGAGASITATFDVLSGQTFGGSVGGGGTLTAGGSGDGAVGSGGAPGTIVDQHRGGGGGGRSSVELAGSTAIVAGGGGGGGAAHQAAPAGVGGGGGFAGIAAGTVAAGANGAAGVDNPGITANGGTGGQVAGGGAGGVNTSNAALNGAAGGGIGVGTGGIGGPDPNFDSAGGGGGGYTGGGGGASTVGQSVTGAGGGGGSSWVAATSPTGTAAPPTSVSGVAGPPSPAGSGSGVTGSISIDWLPCLYELSIDKSVSAPSVNAGDSAVWTVTITNEGPDAMTRGDTVDLADLLPGPTGGSSPAFEVLSFDVSGGSNDELSRDPITCTGVTVGASMPATTNCSRPYSAPDAPEAPSGGERGLDPGETITITYEQVIPNTAACDTITNTADVNDRATTTGTTDIVGVVENRSADATLVIECYDLAVAKDASPNPVRAGRDITWTVTITNEGPADMEGPADDDANPLVVEDVFPAANVGAPSLTSASGPAGSCELSGTTVTCDAGLPAGGVQVLTFTQTVDESAPVGATISNSASVTDPSTGDTNDEDSAETVVGVPGLAMTKSADPLSYDQVGDEITYEYVVTNTGTVALAGPITIDDDRATATCPPVASLAPSEAVTCSATYSITQADLDDGSVPNTATATADEVTSPPDSATVTASQGPAIVLVKSADVLTYDAVGDVVSYTYVITNTGNVTLPGPFEVDDDRTTDEACPATASLAPGDSITCTASYTIGQDDLDDGSLTNVATATNGTITSNEDSVTVTALPSAALSLVKTAVQAALPAAGGVIEYEYEVTNTGNVSLAGPIVVTDDKTPVSCPDVSTVGDLDATLDPGEVLVCTASYTVTQADVAAGRVTNVATAAAEGVESASERATVRSSIPDTAADPAAGAVPFTPQPLTLIALVAVAALVAVRLVQARRI